MCHKWWNRPLPSLFYFIQIKIVITGEYIPGYETKSLGRVGQGSEFNGTLQRCNILWVFLFFQP